MTEEKILKNGKPYIIREAVPDDAELMLSFLESISGESDFLTFGPGELVLTLEQEKSFIESSLKSMDQLFLVALFEDQIIGNLHFGSGSRPRIGHVGEFGVSVLRDFWNNGIASVLMHHLIMWSERHDIRKINLKVREDNLSAITLYKKLGFKEEGFLERDFLVEGKFYGSLMMGMPID